MHAIPKVRALCGSAVLAALSGQVAAQDGAGKFDFYGQLSPSVLSFDDGADTYTDLADNANSNSRAGITYDLETGAGLMKFRFETALGFAQSSAYSQTSDPDWWTWDESKIRKLEVSFKNEFGTFWAGQGSMATDGAAEADLSGTDVIGYSSYSDVAGGYDFALGGGGLSGVSVSDVFKNLDGGRRLRVRYDTPTWSGFSLAAAYGQEAFSGPYTTYYDVALRYAGTQGDIKLSAALGYGWSRPPGGSTSGQLMGSVSALHEPTGVNLTVAAGDAESGGSYGYLKLGWIGDLVRFGPTAFAVEYYGSDGFGANNGTGSSWGLMAVQTFEKISLDVYAGYRAYDYDDDTATDFADASSFMAGARWKF